MKKGRQAVAVIKKKEGTSLNEYKVPVLFHCWGYRLKPSKIKDRSSPLLQETVAVCELKTGEVKLVKPGSLRFNESAPY